MLKKLVSLVTVTAISASLFATNTAFAANEKYAEIYVATDGSDSNPGTKEQPLKTPAAAQQKVREMKAAGTLGEKGTVVNFREGIYPFLEGMHFDEQDSGTAEAPITYRAYLDETVKFIGGVNIDPASFEKVTDEATLNRLVEPKAGANLYRMNLKELGVKEVPMPYLIGTYSYWRAPGIVTEGDSVIMKQLVEELGYMASSPRSPELFVDGEIMSVSKYPNGEGEYLIVDGIIEAGPYMRNWNDDMMSHPDWVPPEERVPTPFVFTSKGAEKRIDKWQTANQAIMWGRWYNDWAIQSVPLASVNPASKHISSAVPSAFSVRVGQPWYIYNLLEEIDMPGEYFLDRDTCYLYLYPKEDINFAEEIVMTLAEENLINIDGASYINFKGIDAGRSRRGIYRINNSDNIHISDADISFTAERAVIFTNCTNSTLKHSYLHDVDGGVTFESCGDMENLIPGNCGVENCEFKNFERLSGTYCNAAGIGSGCGNYIRNNEIHDGMHMGIGVSGPLHEVSFNNLYDLCQESDDSGVFYNGRALATTWGTVIKNNYIHDCTPNVTYRVGTIGVYLDDFMSGVTVSGNIFENLQRGAMFSGYHNEFTNNIFINIANDSIITAFNANIWANGMTDTLIPAFEKSYRLNDAWSKAFPALAGYTSEQILADEVSKDSIVANNYMWNSAPMNLNSNWLAAEENIEEYNITSGKDPGFVDAENKIYLLKEDAEIYKKIPDFQPIPFLRIGLYSERALARVKDSIVLAIDSPYVFVNGNKEAINSEELDQKPIIINNSTYVPFRFLGEALGTEVTFDDATRIATFANSAYTLTFSIDEKNKVTKNGEEITLEVPLMVINGRTYMPLRSISEMIDKEVFWDDCGFITVSDTENIFNSEGDDGLIDYLHGELDIY